jgi:hypothetical protein
MIDPGAMGRFRVLVFGRGAGTGSDVPGLRPVADPVVPDMEQPDPDLDASAGAATLD